MADYEDTKEWFGNYPDNVMQSPWDRVEPLITPELLQAKFLFGVPLVSAMPNPITKQVDVFTPDLLKEIIIYAVATLEEELGLKLFPSVIKERHPFDRHEFESFGYFRLRQRPCSSIEKLAIESSDGTSFFDVPMDWIETGFLHHGQINILPLSPANSNFTFASISGGGPAGLIFMTMLSRLPFIPAYWTAHYTAGFKDGLLPRPINELIGIEAAMQVLSMLAATYSRSTSTSLGIDGMSQSVSGPGPALFKQRMDELAQQKAMLVKKTKKKYGLGILVGSI